MCQRNWDIHGYNGTCNAYQEKVVTDTLNAQEKAKANLEKWYFYYDRYTNNEVSAKLDQELCEQIEKKIVDVQTASGLSWIQATYV
jgi:ariadne-1